MAHHEPEPHTTHTHTHARTHKHPHPPTHTHITSVYTQSLSLSLSFGGWEKFWRRGTWYNMHGVCVCAYIYIYNSWDGGRAGFLDVGVHYQFVPSVPPPWDCYVTDSVTGGRGMLITVQPPRRVPSFPLHCSPGSFFYLGGYLRSRSTVHQVAFSPGQTM